MDRPSNLYGSTKRFNEITALAYHNIYKLPRLVLTCGYVSYLRSRMLNKSPCSPSSSVGCRFFTVYGPWGRPDMAAFKFADKIESGLPIKVYNGGKMMRVCEHVGAALSWSNPV